MADKHATGNHRKCNQVSQEEIWKESVLREYTAAKRWEKNWGFMVQFDSKGKPRVKKESPPKTNLFTSKLPHTTNQMYGSQISSPETLKITKIERLTCYRKRKSDLSNYYC
jgi:hypothetical protein